MTDLHISSAFDRDLEAIETLILKMGGQVEAAISNAAKSLETRDNELAIQVRAADKAIDALEEQVNIDAARLIALRAPAAIDLRQVLSAIKIAGSLERCGDYAKNLAKRTQILNEMDPVAGLSRSIRRYAREVEGLLGLALDSYLKRDVALAAEVRARDEEIDQFYTALFREILTYMMEDQSNISACIHLHFIAKNMERIGDHATAIAEQVIYLVSGTQPGLERPKADMTSTDAAVSEQE